MTLFEINDIGRVAVNASPNFAVFPNMVIADPRNMFCNSFEVALLAGTDQDGVLLSTDR